MRFLVVGGANFVLTLVVFYSALKVLRMHHLLALAAAWAIGMVFSYALNFTWVFKPEEKLRFQSRFTKYFAANLASIVGNLFLLQILVSTTGRDPFLLQCALIPFVVVFNYTTAKFWSLRGDP